MHNSLQHDPLLGSRDRATSGTIPTRRTASPPLGCPTSSGECRRFLPWSRIARVGSEVALLGECPVWSATEQRLYWEDIDGRVIHRTDPVTEITETRELPGRPGSFVFTQTPGRLLVAMETSLEWLDWESGGLSHFVDVEDVDRGNRAERWPLRPRWPLCGGHDAPGPRSQAIRRKFVLDRRRRERRHARERRRNTQQHRLRPLPRFECIGLTPSMPRSGNGTTTSRPGYAGTGRCSLTSTQTQQHVASQMEVVSMLMAAFGRPRVNGWALTRITPDGDIDRIVELPVAMPTMPAFGGPDLSTIYVTSINGGQIDKSRSAGVPAGALLAVDVGVPGLPEPRFG